MQKLDKNAFSIGSLHDETDEKSFWHSKTPLERLEATELMRQINYGYDPATARLQRVFDVIKLSDKNKSIHHEGHEEHEEKEKL